MAALAYRSHDDRRKTLLEAVTDFHGAGVDELYEILRMLSMANTVNRGEIYALYRLSAWLNVRWVGFLMDGHDVEAYRDSDLACCRIQVKAADPKKARESRWHLSHKSQIDPKPYDFLLMLGKRPPGSKEDYIEKEGDYAGFFIPYESLTTDLCGSSDRLDLSYNKAELLAKRTTGGKFQQIYEEFETDFSRVASVISRFCRTALPT